MSNENSMIPFLLGFYEEESFHWLVTCRVIEILIS